MIIKQTATLEDHLKLMEMLYQKRYNIINSIFNYSFLMVVIVLLFVQLNVFNPFIIVPTIVLYIVIIGLYLYHFQKKGFKKHVKKFALKNPYIKKFPYEEEIEINANGLRSKSLNAEHFATWQTVNSINEYEDLVIITGNEVLFTLGIDKVSTSELMSLWEEYKDKENS